MDELLTAHLLLGESEFLSEVAGNTAALAIDFETQKIVHATSEAEKLFQCQIKNGLNGLLFEELIPESLRGQHRRHVTAYTKAPRPRAMGHSMMSLRAQALDGSQFPVAIMLLPIKKVERLYVILTVMPLPIEEEGQK